MNLAPRSPPGAPRARSGAFDVGQGYRGYGNYRTGGSLPTDHRYTGQKLDTATGLMYYNARYYDRTVGHFISPDTLVPDPTSVWDYNRFGYARLNPLKYNDPTGHCSSVAAGSPVMLADMGFCPGGSPSGKSGGGGAVVFIAGGMTAVAAGYLIGQAAHDLMQDVGGYITLDTGPAGSTVHADPLPVTSSAGASFPLADGGPQTSIPATTGVYNDTLNVLADPLPGVDPTGHIYLSTREREIVSLQRSIRSLESNIAEHQRKLEDYIQDPDAQDNQGRLKNASSEAVRQSIIRGRIAHLQSEIQAWQNRIQDLQRQLDELSKQ